MWKEKKKGKGTEWDKMEGNNKEMWKGKKKMERIT